MGKCSRRNRSLYFHPIHGNYYKGPGIDSRLSLGIALNAPEPAKVVERKLDFNERRSCSRDDGHEAHWSS
jgi:hypothetical protein